MNKNFIKQISERCGLGEYPKGSICGIYRGYNVIIREFSKKFYSVYIYCKADENFNYEDLNSFIDSLKRINGVLTCSYSENTLMIMVQPNVNAGSAETVQRCLNDAVEFFQNNRFINCCGHCGVDLIDKSSCLCGIDEGLKYICNDCYSHILQEMDQLQPDKSKRGNIATGILGAVLGSLLGVVVWIIVYNLGFIAGLAGLAIAVCALKGYEKFGGVMNNTGIIICILIIIFMVYFAQTMSYAIDLFPEWNEVYGVSFFDTYRHVNDLIFTDPEVRFEVIGELIFGYALTAIASFSTVRNIIANNKKGNKIVRY